MRTEFQLMKRKTLKIALFVLFLLSSGGNIFISSNFASTSSAREPVIAVITSRQIKPYQDALSGFEGEFKSNEYKISEYRYDLEQSRSKEPGLIKEINNLKPALIFVIGTEASEFAKDNFKDSSIIFSMVLNPVKNGIVKSLTDPGNNMTGVALDISPETQFRKLKEMLPKINRIGVIYDRKEKTWIKDIELAAKSINLSVVGKPIDSASDIPAMLDEISQEADCLWAQVDPQIYNAQSSQYILLNLLRNKKPLMAFSSQYVKAGALLALECDYNDIGRESAKMAIKVLNGENAGTTPVGFPVKINLVINRRIAQVIGIEIPAKLLEEAIEVY
jgi:putative tryptophan/tyrosine transport system substrate-binding protein